MRDQGGEGKDAYGWEARKIDADVTSSGSGPRGARFPQWMRQALALVMSVFVCYVKRGSETGGGVS
jgi:hypothetical protein